MRKEIICEIMRKMTEEERKESYQAACESMVKISEERGNWELFFVPETKAIYSIAVPGSGASNSFFGSVQYVKSLIRKGYFNPELLTDAGRELMNMEVAA